MVVNCSSWSLLPSPFGRWTKSRTAHSCKSSSRPSITAMAEFPTAQVIQARISVAANTGRLDLSNCGLEDVPPEVFALNDLEDLSLAWNNISHISDNIKNLKN
ncbi:hypothetical protein L7F22_048058 [Adiantum nelumboides]|nr:hypothetical protein [Adiantum nelumboides]